MAKTKKKTTTKPIDAAGDLRPMKPETLVVDQQSGVQMVDTGHFMAIDALIEYENNAKIHTPEQIEQICESIRQFGFLDPIAYGRDNIIVEGHGRLYAARKIGMGTVPVINVSHLDEAHQRAYILAHNKLTINTGFDPERYAAELAQICIELPDLPVIDLGINSIVMDQPLPPEPPSGGGEGGGGDGPGRGPMEPTATLMLNIARQDFTAWRKFRGSFKDDSDAFRQLLLRAKVTV